MKRLSLFEKTNNGMMYGQQTTSSTTSSASIGSNTSNNSSKLYDSNSSSGMVGKIRKTFRMKTARNVVALRERMANAVLVHHQRINHAATTNTNTQTANSGNNSNLNRILNSNGILSVILPLLQHYIPMSSTSVDSSLVLNNTTNPSLSPDYQQQLILAALIEMRNSITQSTNQQEESTQTPNVPPNLSIPSLTSTTTTTRTESNSTCQCIHCQLQLYIKATVTKVFENLLLAKELKENRTAHTMTSQEKEQISKALLESEEFSERIRVFQSLNNSSLIQVESIVRNNVELFVMISNVIPQQRSVYIASFDLP